MILVLVFTNTAELVLKNQAYRDVLYMCADYPYYTLVCLLFSIAIPTLLFNFKQLLFILFTVFF